MTVNIYSTEVVHLICFKNHLLCTTKYSCRNRQKKSLCIGLNISIWAAGAASLIVLLWAFDLILFLLVDLSNHSCSCYFWDLVGIPCRHVVAAINYKVENPEAYVHAYYKRNAYQACYGPQITPINGQAKK